MESIGRKKIFPALLPIARKDICHGAQILLRMNGEPLIKEENIEIKS